MEALRTKADSLQWEINRLDAENRRLRADDPAASERVDLEAELEQSRSDVAELTSRVRELEKRQSASSEDPAEGQELEQTTREWDRARDELRSANEDLAGEQETTWR